VILSRPAKLAGAPTVASRFVQRLAAVSGAAAWANARGRGEHYLEWARSLDRVQRERPLAAPAPCPPLALRPKRLSVTEIEHWLRDPYTIYAKHILRLAPLDTVDAPPGARDRGTAIHAAIGEFTERYAAGLPADPEAELRAIGERHFAPLAAYPEARAFWWPRYLRIARWFAGWEQRRRAGIAVLHAEILGRHEMPMGDGVFLLTGRADRIELGTDGRLTVIDYKTGRPPSDNQVREGFSPQLTLEAAILREGGFKDISSGLSIAAMSYVQLRGGEPPGLDREIEFKKSGPDAEADKALARLRWLVAQFAKPETPYRSLVRPMWSKRYGEYDHLARVREWSATGGVEEPGMPS
jgi:ATP-dependent helicase/nuclease subunit B